MVNVETVWKQYGEWYFLWRFYDKITVSVRMSAMGAHLTLGARGEALIRKGCSLHIFLKT